MAKKRMFSLSIIGSDAFLELPLTTQALYFHLNMEADDDGFINNPKRITRLIGAADDDLQHLIDKRFILAFPDGIVVIKHWRMHNTLQSDRYKHTNYAEDFAQLSIKENKSYTFKKTAEISEKSDMETFWKQNGNILETEWKHSIDKNSIEKKEVFTNVNTKKESKKEVSQQTEEWFNVFWTAYPNKTNKKESKKRFVKICTSEILFNTIMEGMKKTVIPKAHFEGKQYIPMASTWLNGERWNDEAYQQPKANQKSYYTHTQSLPSYLEGENKAKEEASADDLNEVQDLMKKINAKP